MEADDWPWPPLKGGAQEIRRGCWFRAKTSVLVCQCRLLEVIEKIVCFIQGMFCDISR